MFSNLNMPSHMKHSDFEALLKQDDVVINRHSYFRNSGDHLERVDFQINGVPFRAVIHKYTGGKWLIKQRSLMPNQIEALPNLGGKTLVFRTRLNGDS